MWQLNLVMGKEGRSHDSNAQRGRHGSRHQSGNDHSQGARSSLPADAPAPVVARPPIYGDRMTQVHRALNREVRPEVLGDRRPALTVLVTDHWDERWLIEIEAIAARPATA
jgi:hypothetical protein